MQVKLTARYLHVTGYVMFYGCRLVGLELDQVCQHRFDNKVSWLGGLSWWREPGNETAISCL